MNQNKVTTSDPIVSRMVDYPIPVLTFSLDPNQNPEPVQGASHS
jgi:hypothetical protein